MGEIIRKTKGGKFVGWYLRYVDTDGQRKQRASKQPSHAEARRMLIEIEARIARGMVGIEERSAGTTLTVEEMFERYVEEYRNPRCKDIAAYQRCARVQLVRGKMEMIGWSRWVGLSLAVRTGMRKGEVFGLRWQDLDLDAQRLTIARSYTTTPKNGKPRHLRLPCALVPLLREWRKLCPSSEIVCPVWHRGHWGISNDASDDHDLHALMRKAECRPLSRPWHLLRHTFASHFMQSGGSLLALSQILGHSDVKMTMIYAHLSSDFLGEQIERVRF